MMMTMAMNRSEVSESQLSDRRSLEANPFTRPMTGQSALCTAGVIMLGVGTQSTLAFRGGGQDIFARIKLCVWKLNKIPEFYMTFARKNARILHDKCPKIFSRFFGGWGGGHVPSAPLSLPFPRLPRLWL